MKNLLFVIVIAEASFVLLGCDRLPQLGPAGEGRLASAAQEPCGYVQNNYGQRVSWKSSLPAKIYLDPSFPEEYVPVLNAAAIRWEIHLKRTAFVFERALSRSSLGWDGRNVLYWQKPWDKPDPYLEGVTSLSWFRNQIVEADIQINADNYTFFTDKTDSSSLHLESLLVHELGHFLGLKHMEASSVMLMILDLATRREIPTEIDKANIQCEYN